MEKNQKCLLMLIQLVKNKIVIIKIFRKVKNNERTITLSNDNEKKLYSERFIVKLSRSKEEDNSEFALDFDPLSDNAANLSYVKKLNGFDLKINSNYSLASKIPDYGANIEVSGVF